MFLQNSNSEITEKVAETAGKAVDNTSFIWGVAYQSISDLLTSIVARLPYIAAGIVVLFIFWIIARIIKAIFLTATQKTQLDTRLRILFSRLIVVGIFILGFFAALTVIIPNFSFGQLIAGLGFTSFIVGFATKDILNNLLSGILILWKQPFKIDDYIYVKDIEGIVEHIGVRATQLKMFDGEKILIPNGEMYSNALTIWSAGAFRRLKLVISIDYQSKVETAKTQILEALEATEGILAEPESSVYVTDLGIDGIKLSIYFWIDTEESSLLKVYDEASTRINRGLREAKVNLYPPRSFYINNLEELDNSYVDKDESL